MYDNQTINLTIFILQNFVPHVSLDVNNADFGNCQNLRVIENKVRKLSEFESFDVVLFMTFIKFHFDVILYITLINSIFTSFYLCHQYISTDISMNRLLIDNGINMLNVSD